MCSFFCYCTNKKSENIVNQNKEKHFFSEEVSKEADNFWLKICSSIYNRISEPSIYNSDLPKESYRLMYFPSVGNSICLRVEKQNDSTLKVYCKYFKMTDTSNISILFNLENEVLFKTDISGVNKTMYPSFDSLNVQLNDSFWHVPVKTVCDVSDGGMFILEGCKNGKYHFVQRIAPKFCKYDKAESFRELCFYILKFATVDFSSAQEFD